MCVRLPFGLTMPCALLAVLTYVLHTYMRSGIAGGHAAAASGCQFPQAAGGEGRKAE